MKRMLSLSVWMIVFSGTLAYAQTKIDDQRMTQDIEVAENVLNTLIKQQFEKRMYFPVSVEGEYMAGYGVTFRLPPDYVGTMVMGFEMPKVMFTSPGNSTSFSYSYDIADPQAPARISDEDQNARSEVNRAKASRGTASAGKQSQNGLAVDVQKYKNVEMRGMNSSDSSRDVYNQRVIEASKTFLADYGDLISQLGPEERVVITNQGERRDMFMGSMAKRTHISIEATKGDLTQYRQGKLTKEQLMSKINVVNSETSTELDPDLELLSSIFSRLYQQDLSKTYFTQRDIYYERLKDYGVIYYMQVYSSNTNNVVNFKNYAMPTVRMNDVDQQTRDAKVKELYPAFEKELKENILDYGRTLKSLKDEELLVVNVKLTRCEACGIPASLELSVKESVLKDYNAGKMTKEVAFTKVNVKKGANQ